MTDADPRTGLTVTHRRYVPYSHAHYAGNLVDGAYSLAMFGDVATEVCIRTDGDEGLFASYSDVQFRAPVRAGAITVLDRPADPGRPEGTGPFGTVRGVAVGCRLVGKPLSPRRGRERPASQTALHPGCKVATGRPRVFHRRSTGAAT